jgi:POT family proton-dependent oligopeptide transporter
MVGDLYNNSRYGDRRDAAFSLFYMAINLGSMFAPMAAVGLKNLALSGKGFLTDNPMAATVCNWCIDTDSFTNMPADPEKIKAMTEFATQNGMAAGGDLSAFLTGYLTEFAGKCSVSFDSLLGFANDYITTFSTGCSYAFALACGSLIISFLIYTFGRRTYAHIITDKKNNAGKKADASTGKELTPSQTKQRVVALLLVFAVVIFFWMVFHQNGQTLTEFAKSCTTSDASGWTRIGFNIWALVAIAAGVYALFGLIQSTTTKARAICGGILVAVIAAIWYIYSTTPAVVAGVDPAMYQQFNPFYVVALTPFSMALFAWLGKKGKEPSAPRKIGYGMIMAGAAYGVMVLASLNLVGTNGSVSPDWLINLPSAHICRIAAVAHGHQLCKQSGSTQVEGLDDGRMVCRNGSRQLPCIYTYAFVGQDTRIGNLGHTYSDLPYLRRIHILNPTLPPPMQINLKQ